MPETRLSFGLKNGLPFHLFIGPDIGPIALWPSSSLTVGGHGAKGRARINGRTTRLQMKIAGASVLKGGIGGQVIADACPASPIIHVDIVSVTNVVDHVGTLRARLYQYAIARIAIDCVMEDAGIDRIPIGMDINPGVVLPHHIVIGNIVVAGAHCDTPALAIINAIVMDEVIAIGIIIRFGFRVISREIMNAPGDIIMDMTPIDQVPGGLNIKAMIRIFRPAIMMKI